MSSRLRRRHAIEQGSEDTHLVRVPHAAPELPEVRSVFREAMTGAPTWARIVLASGFAVSVVGFGTLPFAAAHGAGTFITVFSITAGALLSFGWFAFLTPWSGSLGRRPKPIWQRRMLANPHAESAAIKSRLEDWGRLVLQELLHVAPDATRDDLQIRFFVASTDSAKQQGVVELRTLPDLAADDHFHPDSDAEEDAHKPPRPPDAIEAVPVRPGEAFVGRAYATGKPEWLVTCYDEKRRAWVWRGRKLYTFTDRQLDELRPDLRGVMVFVLREWNGHGKGDVSAVVEVRVHRHEITSADLSVVYSQVAQRATDLETLLCKLPMVRVSLTVEEV